MVQSYNKTSEMQKENLFFFSFPNASNFGEANTSRGDVYVASTSDELARRPEPCIPEGKDQ